MRVSGRSPEPRSPKEALSLLGFCPSRPFPDPLSPQDSPFFTPRQALALRPSQTALSLSGPHHTGDADKFHLAPLGGTAELLCPVSFWSLTTLTELRWLRAPPQGPPQAVYVFREGQDREEDVVPDYKGRTALVRNDQEGRVTLRVRDVRLEDQGPYRCQVQIGNQSREGTATLQVAG